MHPKYILIEVIEREISPPEYYPDLNTARKEMLDRIRQVVNLDSNASEDEIQEAIADYNGEVQNMSAYCEKYGQNFDWQIFKIPIED